MRIGHRGLRTADWLESWLRDMAIARPRTVVFYRQKLALISPLIGQTPLQELAAAQIRQALLDLSTYASSTTVAHVHVTLKTALRTAMIDEVISHNPMELLRTPRRSDFTAQTLSFEQAKRLCVVASKHLLGLAVILAVATGMRSGEILALEWSDVDWTVKTISVTKTVRWEPSPVIHVPKTRAAVRTIPASSELMSLMHSHWVIRRSGLILSTRSGGYVSPSSSLRNYFLRLLEEADCPKIRFHDLRHTAGLFLTRRYGLVVASKMLGHASPLITAKYYGHAPPEDLRAAADGMGDLLTR